MRSIFLITLLICGLTAFAQQTPLQYYEAGRKLMQERKYGDAILQFRRATDANPAYGSAWYEMGWCYNELQQYTDALQALQKAQKELGDQAHILFEMGYACQKTQKAADAQKNYEQAIAAKSDYTSAYLQLATVHYELNFDFIKALPYYQQYVQLARPADISSLSWFRKAYCEVEAGDMKTALESLDKSIAADSNNIEAWNELGYIYFEQGNAPDAIFAYQKAQSIDSNNSTACKGLGDVYRVLTYQPGEAFIEYSKAVKLNPDNPVSHFGVAWCYNDHHEFDKAIPFLQKAIELNGSESAFHAELGYSYYGLKKWDQAMAAIDKSLQLRELPFAWYYKGLVYIAKKDKVQAQVVYDKLKSLNAPEATTLLKKIEEM